MELYALDIETRATDPRMSDYAALQPWRVRQGKAEISSVSVCHPDGHVTQVKNERSGWVHELRDLLGSLRSKRVFGHLVTFDVAFLIGTLQPSKFRSIPQEIMDIRWADTALLVKWLINGQRAEESGFSYSLLNLAKTFLQGHPMLAQFIEMKERSVMVGEDDDYWSERGDLDSMMTRDLAAKLIDQVPESMQVGLMTEWADIVPVANSWVNGIKVADHDEIERVDQDLLEKMDTATDALGVEGSVLNSPTQLAKLLFEDWGLRPRNYTKTGRSSTAGDDLLWMQFEMKDKCPDLAERLGHVITYKKNRTLRSKYIISLNEALEHTGDGYIYGVPRLFGTYTGRMTYSNTTKQKKYKVSIALHQIPRKDKSIRSLLVAPEGFEVIEDDASGQESRLMAIRSGDPVMLDIFARGLNFHSMTGAAIIGMDYTSFQEEFEKAKEGYYVEQRQLGKLTNLSCNYRIGGAALAAKAFTEYDTYMPESMGYRLVKVFCQQYAMIPVYWRQVVAEARSSGYTECFGGRRYKIHRWDDKSRWMSESSAINMPIQGAGASMKEIAMSVIVREVPEAYFALDLHDAMFSYAPKDTIEEADAHLLEVLNGIDYQSFWGFTPPIPLTYESGHGKDFGGVK